MTLVVGAPGSKSILMPVTLFMIAGYRGGDTQLDSAVSPSHSWAFLRVSLQILNRTVHSDVMYCLV